MKHYVRIDLHGTNSVLVVLDEVDRLCPAPSAQRAGTDSRCPRTVLRMVQGIAVLSTYNWYWLVDGLMDAGYVAHLAHVPALPHYSGLKHTDDHRDARWLAHLLRLELLPTGYINPKPSGPSGISCAGGASSFVRKLPSS